MVQGPAMEVHTAVQAVWMGVHTAQQLVQRGFRLLAAGEMGIGNTTTTAAVACALLGLTPGEAVGRGQDCPMPGWRASAGCGAGLDGKPAGSHRSIGHSL